MATILVVDDEAPIVDLLVDIIEDHGYTALRAGNGAEALSIARESRPDLIISDVMMPTLDGFGLLAALREVPELSGTHVILMSAAFPPGGQAAPRHEASADDYLRKPFDVSEVEMILTKFLAGEAQQ
jgi:CheY-like chemotaxis protein